MGWSIPAVHNAMFVSNFCASSLTNITSRSSNTCFTRWNLFVRRRVRCQIARPELSQLFEQPVVRLLCGLNLVLRLRDLFRYLVNIRRVKRRSLRERFVISSRYFQCSVTGNEFHSEALLHLFHFAHEDRAYLACRLHMRSTASAEIEIGYVDQSQFLLADIRKLA